MPKGLSFISPKSKCISCDKNLKFYHNIPLISFIFLRGKCAFCGVKISFSYFVVELIIGFLFVSLFYIHGLSVEFIWLSLIFSLLIALSLIDIHYKIIPEGLALIVLVMSMAYGFYDERYTDIFVLVGVFYILRLIMSFILKQESMGEGDIIIAGIIGSILGLSLSLYAVLVACIVAIPYSLILRIKGDLHTPFVPFLSIGLIFVYFYEYLDVLFYIESILNA